MESKYKTLYEWKKADPKAFTSAKTNGLLPIICEMHGWIIKKPNNYWTLERCQEEALKYSHKKEWEKNGGGSHEAAKNNNWLDECTKHMVVRITKPMGYWNSKENCLEEALKYDNVKDWRFNSNSSYESARKNGWFEECTKHMIIRIPKLKNCWTLELCKAEALKYTTITEWIKNSNSSYLYARRKEWLDECIKHMVISIKKPNNYWTLERCQEEALKFETRTKWSKNGSGSYQAAIKNGWLDECIKHMVISIKKPSGYWTLERCKAEALKYTTITEWSKNDSGSYSAAKINKWVDECNKHMVKKITKPRNYWTYELCKSEALKYEIKEHWKKKSPQSYQAAKRNGWYHELTTHMVEVTKPAGYWTKERCLEHAKHFTTVSEWLKANSTPCTNARLNGWYDECTTHMVRVQVPSNYWKNKERCIEEALKYKTKGDWAKNNNASYNSAKKNGWFEECTAHMLTLKIKQSYWTYELCKEEALKYDSKVEWQKNSQSSHRAAKTNGWFEECTGHMKKNINKK